MTEALLLRPSEAAELCSVSRSKIYELAQSGDIAGVVRLGGSIRIHRPTLEAWLVEQAARDTRRALTPTKMSAPEFDRDGSSTGHRRRA